MLRGLRIAKEHQVTKLCLQIDSSVVAGMLSRKERWNPGITGLIQQCHNLIEWEGWEVKVYHVYREANRVADILANLGCAQPLGVIVHDTPPRDVLEALYADSLGVYWSRRYVF